MTDRPLSYWVAVARMGFENDLHRLLDAAGITRAELADQLNVSGAYVSKVLNGTAGNYQLETMAKWARALGAIVQIRLIKEGKEVVRVVDYETAGALDDKHSASMEAVPVPKGADVLTFPAKSSGAYRDLSARSSSSLPASPIGLSNNG
jgi:transcriptional regulator with XRE-family HTH domain